MKQMTFEFVALLLKKKKKTKETDDIVRISKLPWYTIQVDKSADVDKATVLIV